MAGGTWSTQNKARPGAYINFSAASPPLPTIGDRGIATMAIPLDWGPEGELFDVYSSDLSDGSSVAKTGLSAFDDGAKLLNLMLSNCYLAKLYRLNKGGIKARADIGDLSVTAKYTGVFGNKISVSVAKSGDVFRVTTFAGNTARDVQTVSLLEELLPNGFVVFGGSGTPDENAGVTLSGGTNGTVTPAAAYTEYLLLAERARWQTMALTQHGTEYNSLFAEFADRLRRDEGKYIQVVLANYSAADSISVVNSDCGAVVNGVTVTAAEATAWVAGICAGATAAQSNVARKFHGATRILKERTNAEIIEALDNGMFILSVNQRGEIVVENDINSLHTFSNDLTRDMRLNQVVRVMDEIGTAAADTWEQSFKGRVQNNATGRAVYKATLLSYFNELKNLGAIDEFDPGTDISVLPGAEKDAVIANIAVMPVAAMSKLYMTVLVS